jgi:hypothetical protein
MGGTESPQFIDRRWRGELKKPLSGRIAWGIYIFMLYVFDIIEKIIYNYQGYRQIIP